MFESIYKELNEFRNTVLILLGGFEQILPIVGRDAPKEKILNECISQWTHWNTVKIRILHKSLRLFTDDGDTVDERAKRNDYEKFMDALSSGKEILPDTNFFAETQQLTDEEKINQQSHTTSQDIMDDTHYYKVKNMNFVIEKEDITCKQLNHNVNRDMNIEIKAVLQFLYGRNYEMFQHEVSLNRYVCAATNDRVKAWNNIIQRLNQNEARVFRSTNKLADVDDQYGYLQNMFQLDTVNEELDDSDIPNHILRLKLNDVCLLTTNWSKRCGLTKNTKVKITELPSYNEYKIGIKPVNDMNSETTYITKLHFQFTYHHNCSFKVIRTQFPLRLAYCLTYNRSQGQTADRVVLDIVHPPFSHGQFYVACTRTRKYNNTMLYASDRQAQADGSILVPNVTHKEVLITDNAG